MKPGESISTLSRFAGFEIWDSTHGSEMVRTPDFVNTLPLRTAAVVISTFRVADVELTLLHSLWIGGFEGSVILMSDTATAAQRLQSTGATFVLLPYEVASEWATEVVRRTLGDPAYLEEEVLAEPRAPVVEDQPTDP